MSAGKSVQITLRDSTIQDQNWIKEFIHSAWGAELIVVHGDKFYPAELNAIIAERSGIPVGLATYFINTTSIEVVTLNSLTSGAGIGKKLIQSLIDKARIKAMERVWLITTNDNTSALTFYQKLGFHIVKLYPDAVSKSREINLRFPSPVSMGFPSVMKLSLSID